MMDELIQLERAFEQLAKRWDRFLAHEEGATMPAASEAAALEQKGRELALRDAVSPVERGRLQQLSSRLGVKAASWRRVAPQESRGAGAVPARHGILTGTQAEPAEAQPGPATMEEYRRLFARLQATMERAGEPIPVNFGRFVQELEEQRKRLVARGMQVEGFDVVREPSGVRVRPRTRSGGR